MYNVDGNALPRNGSPVLAFFSKRHVILVVWLLLALGAGLKQHLRHNENNYLIFKYVFWHTVDQTNLYAEYPGEYFDSNHYGPFFSVIIAPFAILPDGVGVVLWCITGTLILFYAIAQLPLEEEQRVAIWWLTANELFTSLVNLQFNPITSATIILAFVLIQREKDFWAAAIIMAGTFVKLYSIVGLAFFFFSKHKTKLIGYCILWAVICFVAPMIFSSPAFVVQSYADWYHSLAGKDILNAHSNQHQDISLMGVVRRISGNREIPSLYFLVPGALLFLLPYLRFRSYGIKAFQLLILCSVMLFVCLFSSSTESSTYIIAFTGVCIWYVMHARPYPRMVLLMMVLAFVFTTLSPTDVFPRDVKTFFFQYAVKAMPCIIIWFYVLVELIQLSPRAPFRKPLLDKV